VKVLVADGKPYLLGPKDVYSPDPQKIQKDRDADQTSYFNTVFALVDSAEAKTPGLDTLTALRMAANELKGEGGQIFVYGPGLSDTGAYKIADKGMSTTPAETVLSQLPPGEIPSLAGATVTWHWFAQAYGDQKSLSGQQVANLKGVMTQIIEKGKGKVTFDDGAAPAGTPPAKHGTTTITLVEPQVVNVRALDDTGVKVYDESIMGFVQDLDVFLDVAAAREYARAEAAWLKANPAGCLRVIGTTTSFGTDEHLKALSTKRAMAFVNLITSTGGDAARMFPLGVGRNFPEFLPDGGPNGKAIQENAQKNRSVRVTRVNPAVPRCGLP